MEEKSTTIQISKDIVSELAKIKVHRRQPYDEVISRLVGLYGKEDLEVKTRTLEGEGSTIKLSRPVVGKIAELKVHPRQAYEEVIAGLVELYKKSNLIEEEREIYSEKRSITTIKISRKVVRILRSLKVHPRQAYDEIILKLLESDIRTLGDIEEIYGAGEITTIKLSRNVVARLRRLKDRPRQGYGEVIFRLLKNG